MATGRSRAFRFPAIALAFNAVRCATPNSQLASIDRGRTALARGAGMVRRPELEFAEAGGGQEIRTIQEFVRLWIDRGNSSGL
jgi:hypothetical protein